MRCHNSHSGFTVIELIVIIVVIMVLSGLAVVNVINTQRNARDAERAEDVAALSRHFEALYDDTEFGSATIASYPGIIQAECGVAEVYDDVPSEIFFSPSETTDGGLCQSSSVKGAQNTDETTTGILPQPSADNDIYVYQAFTTADTLCNFTSDDPACIRFNMYYYDEADDEVKKITSRRQ